MADGLKAVGIPIGRKLAELQRLASPSFAASVRRSLAEEARTQVMDEYRKSRDPYGKQWAPVKRRKRGRAQNAKPLLDSGRMRAATTTAATPNGIRVDVPVVYVRPHQFGWAARNIKQRQIIPLEDTGGLGPIWTRAFDEVVVSSIRKAVR